MLTLNEVQINRTEGSESETEKPTIIPYCVVRAARHNEAITILQARYTTFVPVQRSYKFTSHGAPDFDRTITGRRHYVLVIKVDDVDSRAMTNKHSTQCDVHCGLHVPHGY